MRLLKKITVLVFCVAILLPILKFNTEEGAISEIDNRALATNPFESTEEWDFTVKVENYVNDRIGFRNEMISAYTLLNDRLFGKMVHPIYTYGKDGCVFGAGLTTSGYYDEYYDVFADVVKGIQDYCEERNVPFLFVFDPAKPAVMQEYIPEGVNYHREWVDLFLEALDNRGVHYLDNTKTLAEAKEAGVPVFNMKYDANHWNDLGAFYGINAMLEELKKDLPTVHVNEEEEVIFTEEKEDTLMVSKFPINEMVPRATVDAKVEDYTSACADEIELNESYRRFGYLVNPERQAEGAPRALVFQGSYFNEYGMKYLQNGFGEYIYIHNYQNVLEFPYYYNLFKPECVIFEVAEYTFSDGYFHYERMKEMNLQNTYQSVLEEAQNKIKEATLRNLTVEEGETLTVLEWTQEVEAEQAWLLLGDLEYDLLKTENGYTVTVLTKEYERYKNQMILAAYQNDVMYHYQGLDE